MSLPAAPMSTLRRKEGMKTKSTSKSKRARKVICCTFCSHYMQRTLCPFCVLVADHDDAERTAPDAKKPRLRAQPLRGVHEMKGCAVRIRECALDVLSMEEDLVDTLEEEDSWELIASYLCLKSTCLCHDLNEVIANTRDDFKRHLVDLANSLFCSMELMDDSIKSGRTNLTKIHYINSASVLQQVVVTLDMEDLDWKVLSVG